MPAWKVAEIMTRPKPSPRFASPLHVGRPNIGDRERLSARIDELLDRRWLTNDGPLAREFEDRIAEYLGVTHCVVMCNATVALEIAIRALGLKGEVIVPSFTFVATAHALQWQEITPVFCDIDPATHNLDPACVESLITPRTTGIIGVHLWGNPCDAASLSEIAGRRGLNLLFDAAHAFGCSYQGRMIGGLGAAEIFSFHATKFVSAGEGGAVVTNDDALANKMRLMRNFGFAGYDKVIYVGTNGKLSEMAAALGLTSLESIESFTERNRQNHATYQHELSSVTGVQLLPYGSDEAHNYQYVVLEVDPGAAGLSRDELMQVLHAENVLARRYFYPGCHRMEPYRSYYPNSGLLLPHTEALCARVLQLPTGTAVSAEVISAIVEILRDAVADPDTARHRLAVAAQVAEPIGPEPIGPEE
jgi:dTDP-4-amino-4,6-dideoxygalactose transaminase